MHEWLRDARNAKGLSKSALSKLVDLDISAIGKYERGERRPSVETAKRIAAALGFDWTLFFPEKPKPKTKPNQEVAI